MQIALAALDQATEAYRHGPAHEHNTAFEVAMLAMRLAMEAMQEGSLYPAVNDHNGHDCKTD